jgi:hypothetical protein
MLLELYYCISVKLETRPHFPIIGGIARRFHAQTHLWTFQFLPWNRKTSNRAETLHL